MQSQWEDVLNISILLDQFERDIESIVKNKESVHTPWQQLLNYHNWLNEFYKFEKKATDLLKTGKIATDHISIPKDMKFTVAVRVWLDDPSKLGQLLYMLHTALEAYTKRSMIHMVNYTQLRLNFDPNYMYPTTLYDILSFGKGSRAFLCEWKLIDGNQLKFKELEYDLDCIVNLVRDICERNGFRRTTSKVDISTLTICEKWGEVLKYLLSLLDYQLFSVTKKQSIPDTKKYDWILGFDEETALNHLKDPSKLLYDMSFLKTFPKSFNPKLYYQWYQRSIEGPIGQVSITELLPTKDVSLRREHRRMLALALSLWILSRLRQIIPKIHNS